ncbi:hypothetical protein V6N13_063951 [Hibiscus sabdariffa]|uniref:Uncharacterized protein n=1 Tax=Hibiscus sabdariffa TaxID=183260 RepID=A0ABR2R1W9_9ROSI
MATDGRVSKVAPKLSSDSRFKALEEVVKLVVDPITLDDASRTAQTCLQHVVIKCHVPAKAQEDVRVEQRNDVFMESNTNKKTKAVKKMARAAHVVSLGKGKDIVVLPYVLVVKSGSHVAVSIVDSQINHEGIFNLRVSLNSNLLKKGLGDGRKGLMVHKNASRKGLGLSPTKLVRRISESLDADGEGGSSCIQQQKKLDSDSYSLMEHSSEDDEHSLAESEEARFVTKQ